MLKFNDTNIDIDGHETNGSASSEEVLHDSSHSSVTNSAGNVFLESAIWNHVCNACSWVFGHCSNVGCCIPEPTCACAMDSECCNPNYKWDGRLGKSFRSRTINSAFLLFIEVITESVVSLVRIHGIVVGRRNQLGARKLNVDCFWQTAIHL